MPFTRKLWRKMFCSTYFMKVYLFHTYLRLSGTLRSRVSLKEFDRKFSYVKMLYPFHFVLKGTFYSLCTRWKCLTRLLHIKCIFQGTNGCNWGSVWFFFIYGSSSLESENLCASVFWQYIRYLSATGPNLNMSKFEKKGRNLFSVILSAELISIWKV